MKHFFIINGWGGVGKGEFVEACSEFSSEPVNIRSMVEIPKVFARRLGWQGGKDDASRELIASIKAASDNYNLNQLVDEMAVRVSEEATDGSSTFIDSRETHDIKELSCILSAKTILVTNNRIDCPDCESDKNIKLTGYDYVIENNGTLEELRQKAKEFMENVNGNA